MNKQAGKREKRGVQIKSANLCMPTDEKSLHTLQLRADILSNSMMQKYFDKKMDFYLAFQSSTKDAYGIPHQYIKEIINKNVLTALPSTPGYVEGVINWRGILLPVLNIRKVFSLETDSDNEIAGIIVINYQETTVAIIARKIIGNTDYNPLDIEPPLNCSGLIESQYILGLDCGYISVLNIPNLITELCNRLKTI